jgi:hypothetical protein
MPGLAALLWNQSDGRQAPDGRPPETVRHRL